MRFEQKYINEKSLLILIVQHCSLSVFFFIPLHFNFMQRSLRFKLGRLLIIEVSRRGTLSHLHSAMVPDKTRIELRVVWIPYV
jgi:hypothetical protein